MAPSSSFGRSEFNAFLFASVGEDKSGVELTVLSVLTRLGFDPWQEAARLSELPRETAARLVDFLPRPGALHIAAVAGGKRAAKATSRPMRWLFWLAVAVGWFFLLS